MVDEAERHRLFGFDKARRKDQLLRLQHANAAGQEPDRAAIGGETDAAEDLRETRGLRRHDEVASERDAPAYPDRRSADRRDSRFFDRMERANKGVTTALNAFAVGTQIMRLPGHSINVGTRTEASARPGNDYDPDGVVEPQPGEVVAQALTHFDVQCVEFFGPIQHDFGNRTFDCQIDRHCALHMIAEPALYTRGASHGPGGLA